MLITSTLFWYFFFGERVNNLSLAEKGSDIKDLHSGERRGRGGTPVFQRFDFVELFFMS